MSAKKPKSGGSRQKVPDKKNNLQSPREGSAGTKSETGAGHPDSIFPMVLTSATQELFGCRADEDVTAQSPYKLLRKDDMVQDLKTRAAVSDFSPAKQAVLDYPEDEMLLVFDRDFTYGQSFYLVLTVEAKENLLKPPAEVEQEVDGDEEEMELKTPEPQRWLSLGSEREVDEESVSDSRAKLRFQISRVRRAFGAPINFTNLNTDEMKEAYAEYTSYQDQSFSIRRLEQHRAIQAIRKTRDSSSQTTWKHPRNMCSQYEPRELSEEEKENLLRSENLKNHLSSISARFEVALQQSQITDMLVDEWWALEEEESVFDGNADTHLKEFQTFTDLNFSKDKAISYISWHPTISGLIAVAMTEQLSFEERMNNSTKLLLSPSLILLWSFTDPIHPQLLLECPDDVFCFEFCPSDPNIIVGGCMNGQVVLWDISAHVDRLQSSQSAAGTKSSSNTNTALERDTPTVRYCAVSSIDSGHRAPITDLQWLPENFEVSRLGIPLENTNHVSVQIVSCAPDCCVLFWDLRAPRVAAQSLTDKKHKAEEKALENPHGVPNTFKHLNLTWKPLFKVTLPKADGSSEYSPVKFSLRDCTCYTAADKAVCVSDRTEAPDYSALCQPSAKQQRQLDNISTKFYVGTEDGDVVYTDWRLEKDNESGRLYSPKPTHCFRVHDSLVNSVLRSPFFKDVILTVGTWNFALWKEGAMQTSPILLSAPSQTKHTAGSWSPSRPGVFFIGNEDGNLEVWDLLEKTHEASQNQSISTAKITCIRAWICSAKQQLVAVSDQQGTLHVLELPWTLRQPNPNEELNVSRYFEKEVEHRLYVQKSQRTRASRNTHTEVEQQRRKMELAEVKPEQDLNEEEARKEYQEFLTMQELILKDMSFLSPSQESEQ